MKVPLPNFFGVFILVKLTAINAAFVEKWIMPATVSKG